MCIKLICSFELRNFTDENRCLFFKTKIKCRILEVYFSSINSSKRDLTFFNPNKKPSSILPFPGNESTKSIRRTWADVEFP